MAVNGNIYVIIEDCLKYKNKHFKTFEEDYESKFDDCRNENVEEKERYIDERLSNLRLHKMMKRIELVHSLWDFDAVSLYPSAMWDEISIHPRIETGYAFTRNMIDDLFEKFSNQSSLKEVLF